MTDQLSKLILGEDILLAWLACVMLTILFVNNILLYGKPRLSKLFRPAYSHIQYYSPDEQHRRVLHNWLLAIFVISLLTFIVKIIFR